jgi:TfoX/Sxy family transcriptional regulator of competence genes
MKVAKPNTEILELFERLVPDRPGVECKMMFGARGAWVNGNMFMGTFEQDLVVRLPDEGRAELAAIGGEQFAPMGRPMREYMLVPRDMLEDDTALGAWVERAFQLVAAMPAKIKKPKKPSAPKRR